MVIISADNGNTWLRSNATVWQGVEGADFPLTDLSGPTYKHYTIPLDQYAGDTIRIAFYAQSLWSGGDNNVHLDNVEVTAPVAECAAPIAFPARSITGEGAVIVWQGEAPSYTLVIAEGNLGLNASNTVTVETNSYTFTGLMGSTQYRIGIIANCGEGNSSDTTFVSFTTTCGRNALPLVESFEENSPYVNCWNLVAPSGNSVSVYDQLTANRVLKFSSRSSAADYNQYAFSPVFAASNDATAIGVDIKYSTSGYEDNDLLYFGYINGTDTVWDETPHFSPSFLSFNNYHAVIPASASKVAIHYSSQSASTEAYVDSVKIVELNASNYCFPVTNITVDSASASSVSISWTGTAASYTVFNGTTQVATGLTANHYTFTGLTALTGYTFGVVANCSESLTSEMATIDAVTACAGETCEVIIYAEDSYGDGWRGSAINVIQNEAVVYSYSMPTFEMEDVRTFDTVSVAICSGVPAVFTWNSNSLYDQEVRFSITAANGAPIASVVDVAEDVPANGVLATIENVCGMTNPDSLVVTFTVNAANMGSVSPAGRQVYHMGDTVNVTATANNGFHFVGWRVQGNTSDTLYAIPVAHQVVPVTEFMLGQEATITATFEADAAVYHTVSVSSSNPAWGTVSPAGDSTVLEGSTFTATATANQGFRFVRWSNGSTAASVTITVTSDINLVATFEEQSSTTFHITAVSADTTMGTVTGSGDYAAGATVTLTATAKQGYVFVNWSNGSQTFTESTLTFTAVADATYTATFRRSEGIDNVDASNVVVYSHDGKVVVKGAANSSVYVFDVNGRCISGQANVAENVEFTMPNTGVFFVKAGNAPAKRVVVVK